MVAVPPPVVDCLKIMCFVIVVSKSQSIVKSLNVIIISSSSFFRFVFPPSLTLPMSISLGYWRRRPLSLFAFSAYQWVSMSTFFFYCFSLFAVQISMHLLSPVAVATVIIVVCLSVLSHCLKNGLNLMVCKCKSVIVVWVKSAPRPSLSLCI